MLSQLFGPAQSGPPQLSGSGQNHISGAFGASPGRAVNSCTQRAKPIVADRWPFQTSIRGSWPRLSTTPVRPTMARKTSFSQAGLMVSRLPNPWCRAASRRAARTSAPGSPWCSGIAVSPRATSPSATPVRTSAVVIALIECHAAAELGQSQWPPQLNGCARHKSMNWIMRPFAPAPRSTNPELADSLAYHERAIHPAHS